MNIKETRLEEDYCPSCNKNIDAATCISESEKISPKQGDLSICIECGSYLTYGDNLKLKLLSVDELAELPSDVLLLLTRARNYIKKKPYK